MLILSRRPGQLLRVAPNPTLDPATTAFDLFQQGPMEIVVARIVGNQVDLGISAHSELLILRDEFRFQDWRRGATRTRPARRMDRKL